MSEALSSSPLPLAFPLWTHHLETLTPILRAWKSTGVFPPVLLLAGLAGIGKRDVAYGLAQLLFCQSPDEAWNACGECAPCKKALQGNWVDFREIAAEVNDEGKSGNLKIEQFRELKETQGYASFESAFKVILISEVEKMTPQAANSILKFLEEPPRGWIFILTTNDVSLVLPTIVSRAQRLQLRPLPEGVIFEILTSEQGVSSNLAAAVSKLADGSLEQADRFLHKDWIEKRKEYFAFLRNPRESITAWVDWAASGPSHLSVLMDWLERTLLSLQEWNELSPRPSARDFTWKREPEAHEISALAEFFSKRTPQVERLSEKLDQALEPLLDARSKLPTPANRKILAQEVLSPWLELAGD